MRHMRTGRKLGRRTAHRKAMLANLAVSLIKHGRIKTTEAKAKEVRPLIERAVTFARRGDLHARRTVLARLKDREAVNKLFDEIGPKMAKRDGGYTRIIKLGFRPGDNSRMTLMEFVEEEVAPKQKKKSPKKSAKPKTGATAPQQETAEATPAEAPEETAEAEAAEAVEETVAEETSAQTAPAADDVEEEPAEEATSSEKAAEAAPEAEKTGADPEAESGEAPEDKA